MGKHEDVQGWGEDAAANSRPGVPMEHPPKPVGGTHWRKPEQQPLTHDIQKHAGLDAVTPVFGTGPEPKLLSGALRKWAYSIPTHKVRHWMMLLLADRVDVLEYRFGNSPLVLPIFGTLSLAAVLGYRIARR